MFSRMEDEIKNTPPQIPAPNAFAFLRRPLFIFGALFLAWIFLGQSVPHMLPRPVEPMVSPTPPEAAPEKDAQITELKTRIDELEAKVKTLAEKPADSATAEKIDALQARVDALQQAHASEAGDTAHLRESLSAMKTQMAEIQTQALHKLALLAAFAPLKDTIMRGEPFAEPLRQMNELAKDDADIQPLLAQLAPYAATGTATLSELQNQFEAAIAQALAPGTSNVLARHLQSLVRVRKVGDQQGNDDEAIVARAEARLERGEVEGSLNELAALSPPAAAVFAAWSDKARGTLRIRDTLAAVPPMLMKVAE